MEIKHRNAPGVVEEDLDSDVLSRLFDFRQVGLARGEIDADGPELFVFVCFLFFVFGFFWGGGGVLLFGSVS
jgi:hypothetical protein